jgi:DNA polymerase-3 subunit alpha
MSALQRKDVKTLVEVTAAAERAPLVTKMAGSVSGKQERKSARGNRFAFVQLSDTSGLYEVTVFSDTLEAARDTLEVGANVVLTVEANMESDQLKLLARSISPIDNVTADAGGMGLKVFIDEPAAVASVHSVLDRMARERGAKGPLTFCVSDIQSGAEYELTPDQEFALNPQIRAALRSLPGVLMVEDF